MSVATKVHVTSTDPVVPVSQEDAPFDRRVLRDAFGQFATGVCIVTATTEDGERIGATVNSFTSLSLDPPLVLVCVGHFMRSHDSFVQAKGFTVNVLSQEQKDISSVFATQGADKWGAVNADEGAAGGVILNPCLAYFDCEMHESHVSGDHTILIGRIVDFSTRKDADPLLYFRGAYQALQS